MFLYHVNVGWPLLEEGTRFEAPIARTTWASDSVAEQGASHLVLGPPQPGFVEQVYAHELTADDAGLVRARLVNDRLGLAFEHRPTGTANLAAPILRFAGAEPPPAGSGARH